METTDSGERPEEKTKPWSLGESGIFWIAVTIISSSLEPILAKIGYRGAATPMQLLFIKAIVGAVAILPLTGRRFFGGLRKAIRFLPVTILFTVTNALVLFSLKYVSAIMVITVLTVTPALVALINQAKGNELLGLRFWSGFVLSLAGILLTLEIYRADSFSFGTTGLICIILAMCTSAIYRTVVDDLTRECSPKTCSLYIFVMNACFSSLICIPFMGPIHPSVWPLGIVIGLAAAVANVGFLTAIYLLGSTKSSILGLLQRPLVIIVVALVLKEPLSILQSVGIVMTIIGTQLASVKRRK